MKINQAAEKLQEYMDTTIHGNPNQAKDIILFLEHTVGMLPPFNDWSHYTDGDHADATSITYHTWEDE